MGDLNKENSSGYVMSAITSLAYAISWPIRALIPSGIPTPPPPPAENAVNLENRVAAQIKTVKLRATNQKGDPHHLLMKEIQIGKSLKPIPNKEELEKKRGALTYFEAQKQLINARSQLKNATTRKLADKPQVKTEKQKIQDEISKALDKRRHDMIPEGNDAKDTINSEWDETPRVTVIPSFRK
jgi:hypothetical protein